MNRPLKFKCKCGRVKKIYPAKLGSGRGVRFWYSKKTPQSCDICCDYKEVTQR